MSATIEDIEHIAKLAGLKFDDDEEKENFLKNFNSILDFVSQLQEVDVEGVNPMAHPQEDKIISYREGLSEFADKANLMKNVKHKTKNNGIVIKSPIKS